MFAVFPPMHILLFSSLLYAFSCIFRFSCYIALIERPIFIAIIWGICTEQWAISIPLGIFFELFWMDLLAAGTYIPPNAGLATLLCLMLHSSLSLDSHNVPLLLIMITIPIAYLGTKVEQYHRRRQIWIHNLFVEKGQMLVPVTFLTIVRSIAQLWIIQFLLFVFLGVFAFFILNLIRLLPLPLSIEQNVPWYILWLVAASGGLLSLRTKKALFSFCIAFGILGGLLLY